MGNKLDILIKCIILLYRENLLNNNDKEENKENIGEDNSRDIVRILLTQLKEDNRPLLGGDNVIESELKLVLKNMVNNPENYDKENTLHTLTSILNSKEALLNIISDAINKDMDKPGLKRSIVSLRKFLLTYQKQLQIIKLISIANYELKNDKINDSMQNYISNLTTTIDALNTTVTSKDPGLMAELDFDNLEELNGNIEKVKEETILSGTFQTGWKGMNKMLSNKGFVRGQTWVILSLQHNYKSSLVYSMLAQFATHNKPKLDDPEKTPMILLISFEDEIPNITTFLYNYFYYNENGILPDIEKIPANEISSYIKTKLNVNGFRVKVMRVNPSDWTIKSIYNTVLTLENQGYEIQVLFVDYLTKLPTTYCDNSGPQGTGYRDMFSRMRNFAAAKHILFITPHQASTDALLLKRNGIGGFDFIEELTAKNYYSESRQIPQVVDGEIYITKDKVSKEWFLYIGKGKHRTPVITPDEDKMFKLKFPKNAPIPEDVNEADDKDPKESVDGFDF